MPERNPSRSLSCVNITSGLGNGAVMSCQTTTATYWHKYQRDQLADFFNSRSHSHAKITGVTMRMWTSDESMPHVTAAVIASLVVRFQKSSITNAGRLALAAMLKAQPTRKVTLKSLKMIPRTMPTMPTQTAEILASRHQLPIALRDGLREIGHGHWEGLTRCEVEAQFAEEYSNWEADPLSYAPEGGESGISVLARALPVMREIVVSHPSDTVLVVSHKATIRLLLASLLGFDARGYRDRLDQAPACLNVVEFKGPVRARLMLFNDVSHYANTPRRPEANLSSWWDPPGP